MNSFDHFAKLLTADEWATFQRALSALRDSHMPHATAYWDSKYLLSISHSEGFHSLQHHAQGSLSCVHVAGLVCVLWWLALQLLSPRLFLLAAPARHSLLGCLVHLPPSCLHQPKLSKETGIERAASSGIQ